MLAGFHNRVPERRGIVRSVIHFMRLRPVQITALAAVLLGLVQIGRMITAERGSKTQSVAVFDSLRDERRPRQNLSGGARKDEMRDCLLQWNHQLPAVAKSAGTLSIEKQNDLKAKAFRELDRTITESNSPICRHRTGSPTG